MDVSGGDEVCRVIRGDGAETWRDRLERRHLHAPRRRGDGAPRYRETDVPATGQRLHDAVHAEIEAGADDVRRAALERALEILASPGDGEEVSDVAWPYFVLPDGSPAAARRLIAAASRGLAGDPRGG